MIENRYNCKIFITILHIFSNLRVNERLEGQRRRERGRDEDTEREKKRGGREMRIEKYI